MSGELSPEMVEAMAPKEIDTIYLGYSGGMDSHVLLHLLARSRFQQQVCAVYVHHGLQEEADDWARHCKHQAEILGVRYKRIDVDGRPESRQSPEEAARNARYTAFARLIQQNDVLMLAQHREDQLETVLLQLFRGAGPAGLAGMPKQTAFAQGWLLRPLLDVAQQKVAYYAQKHRLDWIEDPSNQCLDFDRNFLRQQIIPQLKQRWPALDATVSRSARHCADADELLRSERQSRFNACYDDKAAALDIATFQTLAPRWQKQVLRRWFEQAGLGYPSEKTIQQIQKNVIDARQDARPQISTQGHQIKRYRGKLYLLAEQPAVDRSETWCWPSSTQVLLLNHGIRLQTQLADTGIAVSLWQTANIQVGYRQGGEKIALPGRKGRHELKKLFQEAGIPPWLRDQMPLIYIDGQLAAVAGCWISADFYQQQENACYQVKYECPGLDINGTVQGDK